MNAAPPSVLVIDDDALVLRGISSQLQKQGFRVVTAPDGRRGLDELTTQHVDVALIDVGLPDISGLEVLRRAQDLSPFTECVVITGTTSMKRAFESLDTGATEYFEKPINDWPRFQRVLRRAAEVSRLKRERSELQQQVRLERGTGVSLLIGNSTAIRKVQRQVTRLAPTNATVLIRGESGVGKELVADAIHRDSGRRGEIVAINCASISKELIEAELFGHEKGAFTGAVGRREGLLEAAANGTVFLDEIGDMPMDLQTKLLRVLETRRIRRVGRTDEVPMTARVIAATNVDLLEAVRDGRFRQDLYFRINQIEIHVPPLRDRKEDIRILAYHLINRINQGENRQIRRVHPDVLRALERHDWPGNVRELYNVLYSAVVMALDDVLDDVSLLGLDSGNLTAPTSGTTRHEGEVPLYDDQLIALDYRDAKATVIEAFTRHYLRALIARSGGNITRAAEHAGMHRPNFRRLMKQFDVSVPRGGSDDD